MNSRSQELPHRVPGALVNRADLLLAWANCSPEDRAAVAADCGFVHVPVRERQAEVAPVVDLSQEVALPEPKPTPPSRPAELRFLQPITYQRFETAGVVVQTPDEVGPVPVRPEQLDAQPYTERPKALQRWSRLWPFLHHVLGHTLPGSQIDLPRLVDDMAALNPIRRLPRRLRLAWAPQVHILVDGATAMDQFGDDIQILLDRLHRMRGSEGFYCHLLPFGPDAMDKAVSLTPGTMKPGPVSAGTATPEDPEPGATVLVLGDLGCFDHDRQRMAAWSRYGHRLQRRGVHRFALSPCPRERWDPRLAEIWRCAPWDRHERPPHGRLGRRPAAVSDDLTLQHEMLDALLCACSVALRIETPLLRELRLLLPAADAGLEHDLRSHPEVSASADVCAIRPDHITDRQQRFKDGDNPFIERLKTALPDLLKRHHAVHGDQLLASEIYNLRAAGLTVPDDLWAEAQAVSRSCVRRRADEIEATPAGRNATDPWGLASWNARELARASIARADSDAELAAALALEDLARGGNVEPPQHIDLGAYRRTRRWALRKQASFRQWQLCQRGRTLELRPPGEPQAGGAPLGVVPALVPSVDLQIREQNVQRSRALRTDRNDGHSCEIGHPQQIAVSSDSCQLEIDARAVPHWVTRFGWDRCGLFAEFEMDDVTFALRWIPPGEFEMGSPKGEPGRWDAEGPQHQVTIPQGFWIGVTPVTQAQYAALTNERPSRFEHAGDQAPVEQVSWDDCRQFCQTLSERMTDSDDKLTFRLPTEAEWEYACRAGTTTALYTGPLTIVGSNNGPELDAIAWYGGNSGVDYEGAADSSGWDEKQCDHDRAGTHPVGQKAGNRWGLYDMLGNVWEWCEDVWHGNYDGAPAEGSSWGDKGGNRVFRGGCWANRARNCRSAYRHDAEPGSRRNNLGFRLVLADSSTRASDRSLEPSDVRRHERSQARGAEP